MMSLPRAVALGLWLGGAVAAAGEPAARPGAAPEPAKPVYIAIARDKAPLMFQNAQIGELAEGQRVQLLQEIQGWSKVRATFGNNWFEGWVRSAEAVPDSLADVAIKVAPTRPAVAYRDPVTDREITLPGHQFLEVRVKLEPSEKSPRQVFLKFGNEETADLYLTHGRGTKVLPYAFVRRVAGMTRPVFEREEKRQTLTLAPGEPLVETYVFPVPFRAQDFELVIKDTVTRVPTRR